MADRQAPSRRTSEKRQTEPQTAPRRSTADKQAPVRRNDVIRCENCGEDYSITYKRCPFCDERPGRSGISGRRVADNRAHPVQVIGLVISLVLIIVALFIVFKYVGPLLFGDSSMGGSSSAGTSQSGSIDAPVQIDSITLDQTELTLQAGEEAQLTAEISPADAGAEVVWTSSNPDVLTVDQSGVVRSINTSADQVTVTVTASCGDQSAQCVVSCAGNGGGASGGNVAAETVGIIVNVGDSGLNIRSGPGSSYEVLASAMNGARVIILEDTGIGWYKVDYGNGAIGYVSSDYVAPQG